MAGAIFLEFGEVRGCTMHFFEIPMVGARGCWGRRIVFSSLRVLWVQRELVLRDDLPCWDAARAWEDLKV